MSGIRRGERFGAGSREEGESQRDESLHRALGLKDPDAPQRLAISKIRRDGGTQPRAELDPVTIQEYAEDMARGDRFPPGIVFHDGTDYWLARGFTRTAAAELRGETEYEYVVKQGTRRDAILFSVGENADHGLRRTNADKQRAVLTLLNDEEWGQWSNREIARQCHVDEKTVRNLRDSPLSAEVPQIGENTGKKRTQKRTVQRDGTTYQMKTKKIGQASRKRTKTKPSAPTLESARNLDESEPAGQWQDEHPAQPRGLYRQAASPSVRPRAADDSVPTEQDNQQWIISQYRQLAGLVEERGRSGEARMTRSIVASLVQAWGQKSEPSTPS
jgi:hypothetical protein